MLQETQEKLTDALSALNMHKSVKNVFEGIDNQRVEETRKDMVAKLTDLVEFLATKAGVNVNEIITKE